VPRIFSLVFGLGCGLAGLAGVIGGNAFTTEPGMAQSLGGIVFVVVIVGGLGSLAGALVASILIGEAQTLSVSVDYSFAKLFDQFGLVVTASTPLHELWEVSLARIAPLIPYLLLVLIMVVRPRGLWGSRDI
jgi:branched-chain amino acid transport system permease protein